MARHGICFTYNNYTRETLLKCRGAVGHAGITYIIYGREVGEEGTPHLQGYLQANQDKYKRLMKVIGTCHMEKQKGDSRQASDYCKKDGDWVEFGTYVHIDAPKDRQGKRTDLEAIKTLISEGKTYEEIKEAQFSTVARHHQFIKDSIQERDSRIQKQALLSLYENASLKPWQKALLDITEEEASDRKIHWLWEEQGNVGKSWMTTYLGVVQGATLLTAGKKADMAFIFAQKPTKIVVFDLARTNEKFLDGVYSLAEDLKNGRVVTTKYVSKTIFFPPPHVIFFANFEPDPTKWSPDRYFLTKL